MNSPVEYVGARRGGRQPFCARETNALTPRDDDRYTQDALLLAVQLLGWTGFFVAMAFSRMGSVPAGIHLTEKLLLTLLGVAASLALRAIVRPMLIAQRSMPSIIATCVMASLDRPLPSPAASAADEADVRAATGRIELDYPNAFLVDYMTLLKDGERWVIIAKSFHSAPRSR